MTEPSEDRGSPGPTLILVVERDPHVRELEMHFLHEAGYAVEFVSDGVAALERTRELHPHLVITGILVPRLDGLALCRRLKEDPKTRDTMVVIFSNLAAAERARDAGAEAFLTKPLAERLLLETVRGLLAKRSGVRPQEAI